MENTEEKAQKKVSVLNFDFFCYTTKTCCGYLKELLIEHPKHMLKLMDKEKSQINFNKLKNGLSGRMCILFRNISGIVLISP